MPAVARLAITLDHVKPRVTRRLEVRFDIRLDDLHLAIQAAMGWENCHLYEFRAGNARWGIPDPDVRGFSPGEPLAASKATLADLIARTGSRGGSKAFNYLYDFGDGWEHSIKVEAGSEAADRVAYPHLIAAKNACPPEDVGGPWGYAEYLQAIADPKHERHSEMIEWRGEGFDPSAVDEPAINRRLAMLANGFAPRKKAPAKRSRGAGVMSAALVMFAN
jgi:Plasmid pRiA4b ORF-3-like protein